MMRELLVALALLGSAACHGSKPAAEGAKSAPARVAPAVVSDVVKAPRPAGGEYFGLYLMDKKVGYIFTDLSPAAGRPGEVQAVSEFVFKATVGTKVSERTHREVRVYESRPKGRLLSFIIESHGDGGEERLEATAEDHGLKVVRKRPGQADQVLNLPASTERVEDADQARVALLRGAAVQGSITDGQDLESYPVSTTLEAPQVRTLGGVSVHLTPTMTLSEKEKVPVESFLDAKGRMVEINFGSTMRAVAEAETVAKRLDQVEVFGLTRVVLPRPAPASARSVPGRWTLVVTGLPEKFRKDTYRQRFKAVGDRVEVTLSSVVPAGKKLPLPVADPAGGVNLKSSLTVESDNPEIRALAQTLVGTDKDAYTVARRIVTWVNANLVKDYGASADRASDVLRQKRGDCTEHSLLAVALLRAAGIPAKRTDGLVYLMNEDKVPALYWHEWVEAFVGEWTQLDPTFGQSVVDPTHFAVGEEGNAEITPLIGQLKVVEVR